VTSGSVHEATVMDCLICADGTAAYGDKGYGARKHAAETAGMLWAVKEKAKPGRGLTVRQRARNRRFGRMRAKVEHVFRVLKCQFGYRKVPLSRPRQVRRVGILAAGARQSIVRRPLALANDMSGPNRPCV
jgi:IS5 family transposase